MVKEQLSESILDALSIMDQEYPYLSGVDEIAERIGLSTGYFHRLFRKETGETPGRYLRKIKIEKSKELLLNLELTLAEISWVCGFADPCEFNKVFKKETGQTPGSYRKLNIDYISPSTTTNIITITNDSDSNESTAPNNKSSDAKSNSLSESQKLWL